MRKLSSLLLALMASITFANAAGTQIGDLNYSLNSTSQTATVTYQAKSFSNYSGLTEIIIPSTITYNSVIYSVTAIGSYAFEYCSGLESVYIPESVTSISSTDVFYLCYKMTSINVSSNNPNYCSIDGILFNKDTTTVIRCPEGKLGDIILPNTITSINASAFSDCQKITSVHLPDGVTGISSMTFASCYQLTNINIPTSVSSIASNAFQACSKISNIEVAEENPNFCSIDGAMYNKDVTSIVLYPATKSGQYALPKTVKSIKSYSFTYSSITSIDIPYGVTSIESMAFISSRGLTSITIPNSVTSIGTYAFSNCSTLVSLILSDSIKSIPTQAVYGCGKLEYVEIGSSVTSVGSSAFVGCNSLKSIICKPVNPPSYNNSFVTNANMTLYVPAESINAYKAATGWKNFTNIRAIGSNPTITFKDWDGTVLKVDTVEVGGTATPPAEDPWHEGYTFTGWDKDFSNVQYDIIVTAMFETNRYLIQFVDWDGTVLKSDSVYYQGWVEAPENPYRKGYAFTGWDKEFSYEYLIGDMIITAQYMELDPGAVTITDGGAVNALFSVGEGKQVLFSRGNLQFNAAQGTHACADGTTQPGTWRFAGEQYSVRTWDNYNRCETCDNWIDLFYYGTSGYNGVMPYRDDMDVETLQQVGNVEGTNYDFGVYNAISNGGNTPGAWRMFTINEWRYLLQNRPHAYKLYNIVKINDIYGVVILPDNSDTTLLRQEINPEEYYYPYYAPSYSLNEWRQLEAKGAIFLPTGGVGSKYNGYFNYGGANERGYYMISYMPPTTYTSMSVVGFDTTTVYTGGLSMSSAAISVRLVQDVDVFHLNAVSNNTAWGTVSGETQYWNEPITVTATPNEGYRFVQWSDSITDNPRTFTLTSDSTIIAEFAPNTYSLSVTCDAEQGSITGESGEFAYLSEHTFEAVANHGYTFKTWSDGETANPRTVVLSCDSTITALYDINYYPVVLLGHDGKLLSKQTVAYKHAAQQPEVPAREGYTFSRWSTDIESILDSTYAIALYDKIGGTVTYLSEAGDVIATENVDLHLPEAPSIEGKSFKGWLTESADSENGIVLRATYTSDNPTAHDDVTVTPTSNSADVSFPFITGALTYELVIRDMSGNVVCKIMFNSFGQLLGIAFAPSRNRAEQQATQSTGFNFTVEGLNANTTYNYEFVAYDETDDVIETLSGSFTTTDETPTGNEVVGHRSSNRKYIESGHLFIDNNNRTYDARGQQVR